MLRQKTGSALVVSSQGAAENFIDLARNLMVLIIIYIRSAQLPFLKSCGQNLLWR